MIRTFFSFLDAVIFFTKIIAVFGFYDSLWVFRPFIPQKWIYHFLCVIFFPFTIFFRLAGGGKKEHREKNRGKNLNRALIALGPIAIKFGQGLSVRGDIVGADVAFALARLQDKLPPFSYRHLVKTIKDDFAMTPTALFDHIEKKPIAAASIAAVYAATIDGKKVAVKVLRPNIRHVFLRDVRRLKNLAKFAEVFFPIAKEMNTVAMVQTFEDITAKELDLRQEASSATELAKNFQTMEDRFYVPAVYWQAVSANVLTIEWVDGFRIDDEENFKKYGLDKEKLLATSAEVFCLQVFRDGFFHADLHPGNLFFTNRGVLVPIDFGIMGRIDRRHQLFLAEMLSGFLEKNYEKVARAHETIGLLPADRLNDQFRQEFVAALRSIGEVWLQKNSNDISLAKFLPHLFQTLRQFGMTPRTNLLLLQKTIIMAEGLSRMLSHRTSIWQLTTPFMKNWLRENYAPHKQLLYLLKNWHDTTPAMRKEIFADIVRQVMDGLYGLTGGAAPESKKIFSNGFSFDSFINDIIDLWQNLMGDKPNPSASPSKPPSPSPKSSATSSNPSATSSKPSSSKPTWSKPPSPSVKPSSKSSSTKPSTTNKKPSTKPSPADKKSSPKNKN